MENNFGKNLKFLRKKSKITLVNLAKSLKISKSALSDYENGKSKPGLDVVIKLSEYFSIPIDNINNSIISEFENVKFDHPKPEKPIIKTNASIDEITQWKQKNDFKVSLLEQKNESLAMRLALVQELIESKEAENKSLQIQVRLLLEKIKLIEIKD